MLHYPIFVVSKGRADKKNAPTMQLLEDSNLPYTISVEPQDVISYQEAFPNAKLFTLMQNNQGLAYSKQCVLNHCREKKFKRFWLLDDSLLSFVDRTTGKSMRSNAEFVLSKIEELADKYDHIALAAPNHEVIAFRAKNEIDFNRGTWHCVLINTETNIDYTQGVFIEDLNFILLHLQAGWNTLSSNIFCMVKRKPQAGKVGGLVDVYKDRTFWENSVYDILKRFSEFTTLNKHATTGINIRTAWRKFKREVKEA